jgi:tol-pal system protein YbgF
VQVLLKRWGGFSARWRALALALLLGGGLCAPASAAEAADAATAQLAKLESQAGMLGNRVQVLSDALGAFVPPKPIAVSDVAPIQVAQARDTATLAVRLDQLEEQMRVLNGQVEGLQFQLTQLQTLLENMQADNDARFAALEGGVAPGKTRAASQTGGATPAGEAPQATDLGVPVQGGKDNTGIDPNAAPIDLEAPIQLGAPERPLGTLTLDDLSGAAAASGGEVDIGHDASLITDADADAQYKAGYEAVIKGDYAFAEDQFRQFIALFPDHPQAPDATNWLGEALIQRGDYEEAANILLTGFQTYPNATRAPDMLMKLGIALNGTGERETACRTFSEVLKRYPGVSPAFKQRLAAETAKAKC